MKLFDTLFQDIPFWKSWEISLWESKAEAYVLSTLFKKRGLESPPRIFEEQHQGEDSAK